MKSRNVLIISNSFFKSGAEFSLDYLISGLSDSGTNIVLVLPLGTQSKINLDKELHTYLLPLKWFCKPVYPQRFFFFFISLLITTYRLINICRENNIEIILSNNLRSHIYTCFLGFFIRKKTICYIRDNYKNNYLGNILLKRTDQILCVSDYISNQIPVSNPHKKIIYNGVDTSFWSNKKVNDNTLREQLTLDNDAILIAYIAQLTKWKNHWDFLRVADFLLKDSKKNIHFILVGDDMSGQEKNYKEELVNYIIDHGLVENITFMGYKEDVRTIISQLDIILHPAINEPFGRVIIESMSMEKPVIAYNCGGPTEIIKDSVTGFLVEPNDFNIMAEKCLLLIHNEKLRKQFGRAGRIRVMEKFNLNNTIKKVQEILKDFN